MAEKRDIFVRLNLALAPGSERVLKDLATATQRAADAAGTTRNLGLGGIAGRIGGIQGTGQALADLGFGGAGGFLAGRGAIPLAAGGAAVSAGMQGGRIIQDPFMTGQQMGRSFLRDVVPGGRTALSISDTFTGRARGMELARFRGEQESVEVQRRNALASFEMTYNPAQAGRQGLADAFRGRSAVLPPSGARDTALGERAFQEESRLFPLRQQAARLEREQAAAAKEQVAAKQELSKQSEKSLRLETDRSKLMAKLRDEDSGPSREGVLHDIRNKEAEIRDAAHLQRQAAEQANAAGSRNAQLVAEQAKTRAAMFGAQAANVGARAESAAAGARKLGGMNEIEQQSALMALQAVKQFGTRGVPPDLLAMAESIAPETVGKLREQQGARGEAFRQFSAEAPADFAGDPEKLRQQQAGLLRKEAEEVFKADRALAQTAASQGRDLAAVITETIRAMFDSLKRDLLNNARIGRDPA